MTFQVHPHTTTHLPSFHLRPSASVHRYQKLADVAVLVVPIDSAAPKGRLILPQQQTIRDILEAGAISLSPPSVVGLIPTLEK